RPGGGGAARGGGGGGGGSRRRGRTWTGGRGLGAGGGLGSGGGAGDARRRHYADLPADRRADLGRSGRRGRCGLWHQLFGGFGGTGVRVWQIGRRPPRDARRRSRPQGTLWRTP